MGCSSSKHRRDDRNAPLPRSMSLPVINVKIDENKKTNNRERRSSNLKPLNEVVGGAPVNDINAKAREDKLENGSLYGTPGMENGGRKSRQLDQSKTFNCAESFDGDIERSACGKDISANDFAGVKIRHVEKTAFGPDSRQSSFRSHEHGDNSGLRLLLSPIATPSRSFSSSARGRTLPPNGRLAYSTCNSLATTPRAYMAQAVPTAFVTVPKNISPKAVPTEIEGMGDSEETITGSPLFDPSILATFEKAVESSSDDSWNSSDVSNSSSSRIGCSSSDTCSDADSPDWPKEGGMFQDSPSVDMPNYRLSSAARRRAPSVTAPRAYLTKEDYLDRFEQKCPPAGEDKVVLYVTSLRGIRKTYEDCGMLKLILKGYGVQVYERDVWMHCKFRQELTAVIGKVMSVPRLFIRGRYIGGVEEVKSLHEEGILERLLEGLPAEQNSVCDVCGGIRFIPCTTCSGSRKMITDNETLRCPDCNENGLIMCPSCDW